MPGKLPTVKGFRRKVGGMCWLLAVLTGLGVGTAQAATWNEATQGDLSGDRLVPTFLQLDSSPTGNVSGSNIIDGTTGRNATTAVIDRDYLWVNVPAGFVLSELRVGNQTAVGGSGSFIGIATGSSMPVDPAATTAAGLLGFRVYTLGDRNTNILDDMAVSGNGASAFGGTLAPGDYTLWIQELATGTFAYRFNLVLTPVPLPSAVWLFASGLAPLAWLRRRFTGA
jgi:hypothetical protein